MFCPGCGLEDTQANQFCRSCGADMRAVRTAMAAPDSITASASTAREEIGRAVAAKICEMSSAKELAKVTEEVLPEIEKFLESPEEKRLRRMRVGMLLSSIGLGVAIGISIVTQLMAEEDLIFFAGLGVVCFFLGLGFLLNGVFLTVPAKRAIGGSSEPDRQDQFDSEFVAPESLNSPANQSSIPSVTEHTTRQLHSKKRKNG